MFVGGGRGSIPTVTMDRRFGNFMLKSTNFQRKIKSYFLNWTNSVWAKIHLFHMFFAERCMIMQDLRRESSLFIRKICPCNIYPLIQHFYIKKTGVCKGIPNFLFF